MTYPERKIRTPEISVRVEGRPLATLEDIDWEKLFQLIGDQRKLRLKKIVVKGHDIQSYKDLLNVNLTKGNYGEYVPSKKEITLFIDKILARHFIRLACKDVFADAEAGVLLLPAGEMEYQTEEVLSTLAHEIEHAFQKSEVLILELLMLLTVLNMPLPLVNLLEIKTTDPVLTFGIMLVSLIVYRSSMKHYWQQKDIPYLEQPSEIMAREKSKLAREQYASNKDLSPFTLKVDWKRIAEVVNRIEEEPAEA